VTLAVNDDRLCMAIPKWIPTSSRGRACLVVEAGWKGLRDRTYVAAGSVILRQLAMQDPVVHASEPLLSTSIRTLFGVHGQPPITFPDLSEFVGFVELSRSQ
jgi:hypothetical protein